MQKGTNEPEGPPKADGIVLSTQPAALRSRQRLLALALVTALLAGACDWNQFRYGAGHTGSNSDTGIPLDAVSGLIDMWTAPTGGAIDSSPAVAKGRVFVGSTDGNLRALGARTGAVLWSKPTGGPISSSPAVVDGRVYIGSDNHTLRALDENDGSPAWSVTVDPTFGGIGSAPNVTLGTVYVASSLAVYAYNALDGSLKWSTPLTSTAALSAPTWKGGTIYVASHLDAKVWALNSTTGALKWTTTAPGPRATCNPAMSSPAAEGGSVFVALCPSTTAPLKSVFSVDAVTGTINWSAGSALHSTSPAVWNGVVYVGSGSGARIEALATTNGASLWQAPVGAGVVSSPALAGGVLYVGSNDSKLYAFDAAGVQGCSGAPSTCAPLWSTITGGAVRSSPAVANGVVYVGSDDASLHAFAPPSVAFTGSTLQGASPTSPTVADFGPDGRLYVAQKDGLIRVYTIDRSGPNNYAVTASETISVVKAIPNHDDDGTLNPTVTKRLITGLLVLGSAANPVVYVASSDSRIGGGSDGTETNLDTNSGIISRVTPAGATWQRQDVVRGLPRSEENHATNAIVHDPATNTLYVGQGGNTNMGAPSHNFNFLPEYAYSAAVLSIDLDAIGSSTYDLPTLNDEDNPSNTGPFGGNGGKHQAKIVPGGPVQVYAPGFRNPFAVVRTRAGHLFAIDNGPNAGWGNVPVGEGPAGNCTNAVSEPGVKTVDSVHLVDQAGYYGGHPNPTRANPFNTFNPSNPQSPIVTPNPIECDYRGPATNGSIATIGAGSTGASEYTTTNLANQLNGDLLVASYYGQVNRLQLDPTGTSVVASKVMFSQAGNRPVDVLAEGENDPHPGTIWVIDLTGPIRVFEPADFDGPPPPPCAGTDSPLIDEDGDGYTNADEIDNFTDPCSAGDYPHDWDHDFVSDRNDPDDDDDGQPDLTDLFPIDANNGLSTAVPSAYLWDPGAPANPCAPTPVPSGCPGGLLGLGFTGLMSDGVTDYNSRFDVANLTAGGAAGVLTVAQVPSGDALGATNSQGYGFQYGINTDPATTPTFTVHTRLNAPFSGLSPQGQESAGLTLGRGDQDNYAKLVISANSGTPEVRLVVEADGIPTVPAAVPISLTGLDALDLYLTIDPVASTVQASYLATVAGTPGSLVTVGSPTTIPASWLASTTSGLAIGIVATSAGGSPFAMTWALLEATLGVPT